MSALVHCTLHSLTRLSVHSIKLLLRTFDTDSPHPDASCPVLEMPDQSWVTIHISGSILACLFVEVIHTAIEYVVVWNWKTGRQLGVRHDLVFSLGAAKVPFPKQLSGAKRKSFVLVSPLCLVVANLDGKTLDIYDIDEDTGALVLFQRLELPYTGWELNGRLWTYDEALLRSHPTPLPEQGSPATCSTLRPHTELPFTTDESDGIISCTFYCHSVGSSFTLVVHRSALRRKYKTEGETPKVPGSLPQTEEPLVPWLEWGPENTRWINTEPSPRWICYVHGHRMCVLESKSEQYDGRSSALLYDSDDDDEGTHARRLELIQKHLAHIKQGGSSGDYSHMSAADQTLFMSDEQSRYHYLRVFDFNPRGIRRALAEGKLAIERPDATGKKRASQGQILVKGPSVFCENIETRLPYLETTIRLRDVGLAGKRTNIEGVMMNAESIMIMLVSDPFLSVYEKLCLSPHLQSHSSWSDGVEVLTV